MSHQEISQQCAACPVAIYHYLADLMQSHVEKKKRIFSVMSQISDLCYNGPAMRCRLISLVTVIASRVTL
jgi:hypothetical protein